MATYRLKRKTFAFNLTMKHAKAIPGAFNNKGFGAGMKEVGKTAAHGLAGVGKLAGGVAAAGTVAAGAGLLATENKVNS